jgi:carbonic anhydrase
MEDFSNARRWFLRGAGRALIASGAVSAVGLSAGSVLAAGPGALTQTPESQAAITPAKALRMLAEGNARFVRGEKLQRDLMGEVAATGAGQFPFAAIAIA